MRRDLIIGAAVCLVARGIGCVLSQRTQPAIAADTVFQYLPVARSLHAGAGFQIAGSAVSASRLAPLYPMWLAMLMTVAGTDLPLSVIGVGNVVLRTGGALCLYLIANRAFGRRAAIAAMALYIFDPWEAFWVGFALKESLAVPALLAATLVLDRAADTSSARRFALSGIVIGIATLARFANGLLVLAGLFVAFRGIRAVDEPVRRRLVLASALLSGFVLCTSPWLIRNWRVLGEPVFSQSFVGRKFFTSNAAGVGMESDGYYAPKTMPPTATLGLRDTNPTGVEIRLTGLTLKHMATHPGEVAVRTVSKVVNMWRPTFERSSKRNAILLGLPYVLLMVVSVAGLLSSLRSAREAPVLYSTLFVFLCAHLIFRGEIRNRQYLMPLFYAFGGLALSHWLARDTRRKSGKA